MIISRVFGYGIVRSWKNLFAIYHLWSLRTVFGRLVALSHTVHDCMYTCACMLSLSPQPEPYGPENVNHNDAINVYNKVILLFPSA